MHYELKRYPFCGGTAQILRGGLRCTATVECRDCGATVKGIDELHPIGTAVRKWNARVQAEEDK